jgi:hypothetical protein
VYKSSFRDQASKMDTFDSPSMKKRFAKPLKQEEVPDGDVEDDEFFKRWAGAIFLGPFLPAIFALIVIFTGQLTLNTYTGTCGYDLPCKTRWQ